MHAGVRSCIATSGRSVVFDGPTDGGVVDAEIVGHCLHGIIAGLVGDCHGFVAIMVNGCIVPQRLRWWPTLQSRNFGQVPPNIRAFLHLRNKFRAAQKNLLPQSIPDAG